MRAMADRRADSRRRWSRGCRRRAASTRATRPCATRPAPRRHGRACAARRRAPADWCAFEAELLRQHGLPHGVGINHRLVHFQHLFSGSGYAAGYYVYLWAEVLDADGFDAFTEAGSPFDAAVAAAPAQHIYAAGNSVEPGAAFAAFRGRPPHGGAAAEEARPAASADCMKDGMKDGMNDRTRADAFQTAIAGSLPKPGLAGRDRTSSGRSGRPRATTLRAGQGRRHAAVDQGAGRRGPGRRSATASSRASTSCTASSSRSRASTSSTRSKMGIRNNRYDAMVPQVVAPLRLQGPRACRPRRGCCARTPRRKIKFTLPGPMTIVDTVADRFYGDRVEDGDGLRRAAEPGGAGAAGRRRRHHPVRRAGLQRLHGGRRRLGREGAGARRAGPDLHDRRAHLLRLRHQGQHRLEEHAGRGMAPVRAGVPGAGRKQHRPGQPGVLPLARAAAT